MATGQTLVVALTVDGNVLHVAGLELLHGGLDDLHTTIGTSSGGGNVGVKTGTVPLTLDGLGLEGDTDTELLSDTVEDETGHPEVVTHCIDRLACLANSDQFWVNGAKLTVNAGARANLVLPLRGHDLGVDTGDVDTSVQASPVVSLDNVTAVDLASTDTTVVRTLGTGETATGPAIRPAIGTEKGVLLLQTEPELLLGVGLHQAGGIVAVVELVWASIGVPGLAEDEDVVTLAEGVGEDSDGAEVDIGVVTGGLAGGGTVEVPLRELVDARHGLGEGLWTKRQLLAGVLEQGNPGLAPLHLT